MSEIIIPIMMFMFFISWLLIMDNSKPISKPTLNSFKRLEAYNLGFQKAQQAIDNVMGKENE